MLDLFRKWRQVREKTKRFSFVCNSLELINISPLVCARTDCDDDKGPKYKFGIYGLKNKTELLQTGDPVRFQIDSSKRAVNIVALRTKSRATVESMKGTYTNEGLMKDG